MFQIQKRNLQLHISIRFCALIACIVLAFFLSVSSFLFGSSDSSMPWNEEYRILPAGQKPIYIPSEQRPQLNEILRYRTSLEKNSRPCGSVNVVIYPDGIVKGLWNGEYEPTDDIHCNILAASFAGNIDPSKAFIGKDARDSSRLYFITNGTYCLLERDSSIGRNRNINGYIYVRGWICSDYTVIGELIVTEDLKNSETYYWVAGPDDR